MYITEAELPNPLEDATLLTTSQILGLIALQCTTNKLLKPLFWSLVEEHTIKSDPDQKSVYFHNLDYGLQIYTTEENLTIYYFKNGYEPIDEQEVTWDDIEYLS